MKLKRARQVASPLYPKALPYLMLAAFGSVTTFSEESRGASEFPSSGSFLTPSEKSPSDCEAGKAHLWGTLVGAGLGAILGNKLGDGKTSAKLAGAALGGIVGNLIGREIDRRNCELDKIAQANDIEIAHEQIELKASEAYENVSNEQLNENTTASGSVVTDTENLGIANKTINEPLDTGRVDVTTWRGEQHFESGSSKLTPKAKAYFTDAALQYKAETVSNIAIRQLEREATLQKKAITEKQKQEVRNEINATLGQRPIVLIGHTDDTGNSASNQILSEKRSRAVAELFRQIGIPAARLYFRGAGETDPIATNTTEEGRALNRRVEIMELQSRDKLLAFATLKQPKYELYRPAEMDEVPSPVKQENVASSDGGSEQRQQQRQTEITDPTEERKRQDKPQVSGHNNNEGRSSPASANVAKPQVTHKPGGVIAMTPVHSSTKPSGRVQEQQDVSMQMDIDLQGQPANDLMDREIREALGKPGQPNPGIKGKISSLSTFFIKSAHASGDTIYSVPCTRDRARYAGEYKSLSTGQSIRQFKTAEYSPGLFNTTWTGVIGNSYAGVVPVAVLRANYEPVSAPLLYLYANTHSPSKNTKASWRKLTVANVYPAENGLLYRIFSKEAGDFVCADIVMPYRAPFKSPVGKLYYRQNNDVLETRFSPSMLSAR